MAAPLVKIERQVNQLLERVLDAGVPSVIAAYENRIKTLEEELLIKERRADTSRPKADFDKTLRTARGFLANPCNLWNRDRLEDRRAVLKLAFASRLRYTRKKGFRTAKLSMPLNLLTRVCGDENEMARPKGSDARQAKLLFCMIASRLICSSNVAGSRMNGNDQAGADDDELSWERR